jgi:hypothetical protein
VTLATRVMRARRTGGICPTCRRTLIRGTSIALAAGRWHHAQCVAQRIRDGTDNTAPAATSPDRKDNPHAHQDTHAG